MARRRYRDDGDSIWGIVSGLIGLYVLYLVALYFSDRAAYWRQFWYFVAFLVIVLAGTFTWKEFRYRMRERKLNNLLNTLKRNNLEQDVNNFIDTVGVQKGKKDDWTYEGYSFTWQQLEIFRNMLNEKGMHLALDNWNDLNFILHHFIKQKEERFIRDRVSTAPKHFASLSGTEFENLLYRLFAAMGHSVQRKGGVGDQGGDLIVNMGSRSVLVQAKRWAGSIGNTAVQQAFTAKQFYNCSDAWVVGTSDFTREAIDAARKIGVELVGKGKLSDLLSQYLKENWS